MKIVVDRKLFLDRLATANSSTAKHDTLKLVKMKLGEFKALVIEQRKAQQAQNLEAILSVASATITETERKEN